MSSPMMSLERLPSLWAEEGVDEREQGQYIAEIAKLARQMRKAGWSDEGEALGLKREVKVEELWYLSELSLDYADEEINAMGDALIDMQGKTDYASGQVTLMTVMKCHDPRPGKQNAKYLILDGKKRYKAMIRKGIRKAAVDIREYFGFYDYAMQVAIQKLSQHDLTYLEIGRFANRVIAAYAFDKAAGGDDIGDEPTGAQIGRKVNRSQSTISRCMALEQRYREDAELARLIDSGQLAQGQAIELVSLPKQQMLDVGHQAAQASANGTPMTQQDLRDKKKDLKGDTPQAMYWPEHLQSSVSDARELYSARLAVASQPLPALITVYAHDLSLVVDQAIAAMEEKGEPVDSALRTLQKTLRNRRITDFIQDTLPQLAFDGSR